MVADFGELHLAVYGEAEFSSLGIRPEGTDGNVHQPSRESDAFFGMALAEERRGQSEAAAVALSVGDASRTTLAALQGDS